jgi:iron complex transport system substrate-binding protein
VLTAKEFRDSPLTRSAVATLLLMFCSTVIGATEMRIASLNLCTDSMLFELADPKHIVSVTSLSRNDELSHFSGLARKLPINRGLAEEIIALEPDLVLTGSYTATGTSTLLSRFGYRVMTFQPALSLAEFRSSFLRLAEAIGEHKKAVRLLARMDNDIAAIGRRSNVDRPRAIIYRPNGFSPGRRSLANEMLKVAGVANLADEFGIEYGGFVPLEQLVTSRPDIIILDDRKQRFPALADMILAHPALRISESQSWVGAHSMRINIAEKFWACGGTFIADAASHLAARVMK